MGVRTIAIVTFDGATLLDVVGPAEVWFAADRVLEALGRGGSAAGEDAEGGVPRGRAR